MPGPYMPLRPTLTMLQWQPKILCLGLLSLLMASLVGCVTTPSQSDSGSKQKSKELNQEAMRQYAGAHFEKAVRIWNSALARDPASTKLLYNLGLGYFALQKYEKSVNAFTQALEQKKDFSPALINRAMARIQIGEFTMAREDLEEAARLNPDDPVVRFNLGLLAQRQDKISQALDHYTAALEIQPQMSAALNNRGICYLEIESFLKAVADFTQAIRHQDPQASLFFNRAIAWESLSRYDDSVSDYTKALTLNPNLAPAFYNRGLLRINLNRKQLGCQDLQKACDLGMCEQLHMLQDKGICPLNTDHKGHSESVPPQLEQNRSHDSTILNPDQLPSPLNSSKKLSLSLERLALEHNNPDDTTTGKNGPQPKPGQDSAPKEQAHILHKSLPSPDPLVKVSSMSNGTGKKNIDSSPDLVPDTRESHSFSIKKNFANSNPRDMYTTALSTLLEDENYPAAKDQLEEFISLFPDSPLLPNAVYWLGETYYVQYHYAKAIRIFKNGAERFSDHQKAPAFLLKTGLAYLCLQQPTHARNYFNRLISKHPTSHPADIARQRLSILR